MKKDLYLRVVEHDNGYSMLATYGPKQLIDEIVESKSELLEKLEGIYKTLKED